MIPSFVLTSEIPRSSNFNSTRIGFLILMNGGIFVEELFMIFE